MPLGDRNSQFFVPVHGRYAVRLIGEPRDGKRQQYDDGSSSIPVFWPVELYNADGTPVRDPAHPERPVAIADVRTGQSVWFTSSGEPTQGRKMLAAFAEGQGRGFAEDYDFGQQEVLALVKECIGGWAWLTWGAPTNKRSKATSVVRKYEPMIPQPAKTALPAVPALSQPADEEEAPAAPAFTAPAVPVFAAAAAAEAPAAPVFAAAPAAPVFPAAPAATEAAPAIPAMVFPA